MKSTDKIPILQFNYPQELFDSSKTVLGCIPSDKFRVIHRSLLFDAIEERKHQQLPLTEEEKKSLLVQVLDALNASKEKTHVKESSENQVDKNEGEENGISRNLADEAKEEQNDKESLVEEDREERIGEESSENNETEERNKETENPFVEDNTAVKSEQISEIVAVLEKIEQVHREQDENLIKANQDLQDPGVTKVSKMQEKIRKVKENLGTKDKKDLQLLDQPNAKGVTALHLTSRMDDDEATRMLLEHGANPNVQDSDGNSPLHTICDQRDIETATCIIKNHGRILSNNKAKTPTLAELFFDQNEEKVNEMMEAVAQSRHRTEILDEVLRKEQLVFRLVDEDMSGVLSIVLKKLNDAERENFVNLVRDQKDQNSALHVATLNKKSLKCSSLLLEAGASSKTNAMDLIPKIEDFFTK